MSDLSSRQTKILQHIVEEYIDTARPVGSELLDRKYNLGVSPATLRNEMVALTEMGYLKQPHTSAGRAPTPEALRYYVNHLMQTKNLATTEEVKIKERVWDFRKEEERSLREVTLELADRTKSLAVASNKNGDVYFAGTANILDMPEFFDIDLTRHVLSMLDHFELMSRIFDRVLEKADYYILMGDDLGNELLAPCGVVFTKFGQGKKHEGTIGIIGPYRLNYPKIVPTIKYFGDLIDEMAVNW